MKLKFNISIANIIEVFKRFPLTIIFTIIATLFAVSAIEYENADNINDILKFVMSSYFGIFLSLSLTLVSENFTKKTKYLLQIISVLLVIYYYFNLDIYPYHLYRFAALVVSTVFLIFISFRFLKAENIHFWQFSKVLILRFLQSTLFSWVLFIGLSIALFATKELFGINWKDDIYPELAVSLFTLFNIIFFLSGIPKETDEEIEFNFPNSLRLLSSYILIPITILYAVILYIYLAKILVTMNLPNGWVSSLVIYYSITGILAYNTIYPIKDKSSKYVSLFAKWFFVSLIPLTILMSLAITTRISAYSITENRILVLVYNIWLYFIAFYYILSKNKKLLMVPLSLMTISISLVIMPWNIMTIAEKSQILRFEQIMTKGKVLENGKINHEIRLGKDDAKEAQSIINYLEYFHKFNGFKKWLVSNNIPLDTLKLDSLTDVQVYALFHLNWEFKFNFQFGKSFEKSYFKSSEYKELIVPISEINNYDFKLIHQYSKYGGDKHTSIENPIDKNKFEFTFTPSDTSITLKAFNSKSEAKINIGEILRKLQEKVNNSNAKIQFSDFSIVLNTNEINYKIVFNYVDWSTNQDYFIDRYEAEVYYKINNKLP